MNTLYTEYKNKNSVEYTKKANGLVILNDREKIIDMKLGKAYISVNSTIISLDKNHGSSAPYIPTNHEVFYYGAENKNDLTSSACKIGISGMTNYTSSDNLTFIPEAVLSDTYLSASSSQKKYTTGYYYVNTNRDLYHYASVLLSLIHIYKGRCPLHPGTF